MCQYVLVVHNYLLCKQPQNDYYMPRHDVISKYVHECRDATQRGEICDGSFGQPYREIGQVLGDRGRTLIEGDRPLCNVILRHMSLTYTVGHGKRSCSISVLLIVVIGATFEEPGCSFERDPTCGPSR